MKVNHFAPLYIYQSVLLWVFPWRWVSGKSEMRPYQDIRIILHRKVNCIHFLRFLRTNIANMWLDYSIQYPPPLRLRLHGLEIWEAFYVDRNINQRKALNEEIAIETCWGKCWKLWNSFDQKEMLFCKILWMFYCTDILQTTVSLLLLTWWFNIVVYVKPGLCFTFIRYFPLCP